MKCFILSFAALMVFAWVARGDVLPTGSKWFHHQVTIDNLNDYPQYVFFVYPKHIDVTRGAAEVKPSKPVAISDSNPLAYSKGMYFYAVPRETFAAAKNAPLESWFGGNAEGVLRSSEQLSPRRSTRKSDSADLLVSHYVASIKEGRLTMKNVGDKRFDSQGAEINAQDNENENSSVLYPGPDAASRWLVLGVSSVAAALIGVSFIRGRRLMSQ